MILLYKYVCLKWSLFFRTIMIFFLHCDTILMSSPPSNSYGAPAYRDMVVENNFGVGGNFVFAFFVISHKHFACLKRFEHTTLWTFRSVLTTASCKVNRKCLSEFDWFCEGMKMSLPEIAKVLQENAKKLEKNMSSHPEFFPPPYPFRGSLNSQWYHNNNNNE